MRPKLLKHLTETPKNVRNRMSKSERRLVPPAGSNLPQSNRKGARFFDRRLLVALAIVSLAASILSITAYMQGRTGPQEPAKEERPIALREARGLIRKQGADQTNNQASNADAGIKPDLVTITTYPFTTATGVALEDMSSGTSNLVAAGSDDGTSASLSNIGFEFWYDGVRFTQFGVNANGFARLGALPAAGSIWDNSINFATNNDAPKIAPFYDDLCTGTTGQVHTRTIGTAPNRKLIVEWQNMQITRNGGCSGVGGGTFQMWLFESSHASQPGIIEFVYGPGMVATAATDGGYSVGLQSGAATNFASVTTATNTVSYATANNTQTTAITAGRAYIFTPNVPATPTGLNFTALTSSSMTLNWTDIATNEFGYAIYRSTDGTNYSFINQTAANAVSSLQSGLTPSTTYFWKVYAVTEGALSNALSGSQATNAPANIVSTGAGGAWSATGTWVGGAVPTATDNATIADGATVTIDTPTAVANTVTVGSGAGSAAILTADGTTVAKTLTVTTDVTINSNGTVRSNTISPGSSTLHGLSVGGSMSVNGSGTYNGSASANSKLNLTFTGAANSTFTTSATATISFNTVTINKGASSASVLDFSPGANWTATAGSQGFTITNGTLKVSGSATISNVVFNATSYTIPATGGIWLNNSNFTINGQTASPTNSGLLRVTAGTFNVGTASGNAMGGATTSVFIIEGGIMNFSGRLNVTLASASYTQSAGIVNICTVGNAASSTASFGFTSASSSFTMSGGTINLVQANSNATPLDYNVAGVTNVTGGTLNIGTAATATNFSFRIQGGVPNLVINNTTNNKLALLTGATNVFGDVTVNTGTTLNAQASTIAVFGTATNVGNVTNNGTITNTSATGTNRLQFSSTFGAETYSGSGTFGSGTAFAGLNIANSSGVAINAAMTVTRVNLFSGGVTNANNITIGTGGVSAPFIQVGGTASVNAGSFIVAPTFNIGSGGLSLLYATANAETTGNEIPASRSVLAVTINNDTGVTLAGGALSVTGTLTLTAGNLVTSTANLLTVTNTATGGVSGGSATSYVNGPLARILPTSLVSGSTYTLPVGKSGFNMLELVNPTTGAGGTLTVQTEVFDANSGGTAGSGINGLNTNRYWQTAGSGPGSLTNTTVRLTEPGVSSGNRIGQSATQAGTYNSIGGSVVGSTILSTTTSSLGFFNIGFVGLPGGTYTVGAGGDYSTLTAAAADYNLKVITGPVIFSLTDLTYGGSETFPITFNANSGANATNTLTIKPAAGVAAAVSGSSPVSSSIIKLNGADWITIDGVNSGGRSLSLTNTRTTTNTAVIWLASLAPGQGATNDTIRNLTLTGGTAGTNAIATFGVIVGGSSISINPVGDDNDNVTITGNTITKVQHGIFVEGNAVFLQPPVSAGGDDGLVITNNIVGPATIVSANNIGGTGIFVQNALAPNISGNVVRNVIAPVTFTFQGWPVGINISNDPNANIAQNTVNTVTHPTTTNAMWATGIYSALADGGTITGNVITGVSASASNTSGNIVSAYGLISISNDTQITGNTVTGVTSASTTGCPARGIWINNNTNSNITLANNSVSDIVSYSNSDTSFRWQPVGIYIDPFVQSLKLYHNSVNLFGAHPGVSGATIQAALFIDGSGSEAGFDVRDNILVNTYDNSSSATDKSYAIYSNATASTFTSINYDDYFVSGTPGVLGALAVVAGTAIDKTTIAAWRTATGQDVNSFSSNPQFASNTNLHITRTTPSVLSPVENVGVLIAAAGNDIDGDMRANPPDIGADEVMTVNFSAPTYRPADIGTTEGQTATITVNRTSGAGAAATVNFTVGGGSAVGGAACTAGVDYITPASLSLSFGIGDTSKTFNIITCADGVYEGNEDVTLTLTTVTGDAIKGTPDTATLTIIDGDAPPSFSIDDVSLNEGNAGTTAFTFTVTKTGLTALPAGLGFSTANDTATTADNDYQFNIGTLSFAPTDTTKQITVLVNGDLVHELDETFFVNLFSPSNATISDNQGVGTIVDDDAPAITTVASPTTITDSVGQTSTVTFSSSRNTATPITVGFSVGGTAVYPTHYTASGATSFTATSGTVTFNPGETTKDVILTAVPDSVVNPDRTIVLTITAGTGYTAGSPGTAGVTIQDDDTGVSVTASAATVDEGGDASFTISCDTHSYSFTGHFSVSGTASFPADYTQTGATTFTAVSGTIDFAAGETSKDITIHTIVDSDIDPNETVILTITAGAGYQVASPSAATITITEPAAPATLVVTNTSDADGACLPGNCSLRQAINSANSNPGDANAIDFNIPNTDPNFTGGIYVITPGSALPAITGIGTIIDGASQTTFGGNTNAAGPEIEISGALVSSLPVPFNFVDGLRLMGSNGAVKGLIINGFDTTGFANRGILITSNGNVVQGNFIGTNGSGAAAVPNGDGILIQNTADSNTIGGNLAGQGNVISGNSFRGIVIQGDSSGTFVQANYIGVNAAGSGALGNSNAGIELASGATMNLIGTTGFGNVISGNGGDGVKIGGATTFFNNVQGNYIGTNAAGTAALGNAAAGVRMSDGAANNNIGGLSAGTGNLISANGSGVIITGAGSNSNHVQGNYIGTDVNGTAAIGNLEAGVDISGGASNNEIGNGDPSSRNLISGNSGALGTPAGVLIRDNGTSGNTVLSNYIGVAVDGTTALGNTGGGAGGSQGVMIMRGAANNVIGGLSDPGEVNIIANNSGDGVQVWDESAGIGSTAGNTIRGNSIYGNTLLGINLMKIGEGAGVVTANDVQDVDNGPNGLQNFPIITTAVESATTVSGTLNSTPGTIYEIDVYGNPACDASGNGEGRTYLGSVTTAATNGSGDVSFTVAVPALVLGNTITAVATDQETGDTSEFSACYTVTAAAGDITFNADGNLNAGTYNNITINSPAVVTMTGDVVVNGCVFVNSGSTLLMGNFTFTGAGCFTLSSGGTLGIGSSAGITTGASGNVQVGGARTFSAGGSYIYDGTADQAVGNALPATVANLKIANTGTPGTVTGNTGQIVTGTLSVLDGVYASASDYNDVVIANAGTLSLTGDITVSGQWTNDGTFTPNANAVTFEGAASQSVGGTGTNGFAGLTMDGAGGVMLSANASVSGALTLTNGKITTGGNTLTLGNAATTTGASSSSYVIGSLAKAAIPNGSFSFPVGTANGYTPLDLANATGGGDLSVTTKTPQQPVLNPSTALQEYWTITKTGTLTTDLTFHYLESDVAGTEANYRIVKVEGGVATSFPNLCPAGNACVDPSANTATAKGVEAFSDWTVAEPDAPTAVRLAGFSATRINDEVMISWQSGFEARNLGYYVYREQKGVRTQITPSLVAGSALLVGPTTAMGAGHSYTWYDQLPAKARGQSPEVLANYWIEDVDVDGTRTWHGPITAEVAPPNSKGGRPIQTEALGSAQRQLPATGTRFSSWPADFADQQKQLLTPPVLTGKGSLTQREIAGMPGLKIAVSKTGWYRITRAEMMAAGFNPKDTEPLLQLYANAVEVPVKLSGATLDADGDYLEFFGHGLDSPTDAAQTYYLVVGRSAGKRILMSNDGRPAAPSGPQNFDFTIERKDRFIYYAALLNGDGENMFGHIVRPTPVNETLPVSNPDLSGSEARLEVSLVGVTQQSHHVAVSLNGQNVGTVDFSNNGHPSQSFVVPVSLLLAGDNTVQFAALGGDTDVSLVDYTRLTYPHLYAADHNALAVGINSARTRRVSGFTESSIRAVDITNPGNLIEIVPAVDKDDDGGYTADVQMPGASQHSPRTLLVFSDSTAAHPDSIKSNEPSAWGTHTVGSDYLIITSHDLKSSVEPLAALRRGQGMVVDVIDVEDLFDEFSFGVHSPQAIKTFLQTANANWQRRPHFVLFAGDASYDPKNYTGQGYNDLVPTKLIDTALLETASDDWLADFNNDGIADLAIGRLPARTAAAMDLLVGKIIGYENMTIDPSRPVMLVADTSFEAASTSVQSLLPVGVPVQTINRSSADDTTIHNQIINSLNQGPRLANYFGHGSNGVWTGAGLLSTPDAPALTNQNRLSVFVMMTCFNGYFQDASFDSLAEGLMKSPNGAVAVWASSGMTAPAAQTEIDLELYRQMFGGQSPTLGDAVRSAKQVTNDADVRRTWILFGDPAMRLR